MMKSTNIQNRLFTAAILAWASALAMTGGQAQAGPEHCTTLNGPVLSSHNGNHWVITATDGSVLQCLSFDIGVLELVEFLQPSATAPEETNTT